MVIKNFHQKYCQPQTNKAKTPIRGQGWPQISVVFEPV
jgi:hypothetical protein